MTCVRCVPNLVGDLEREVRARSGSFGKHASPESPSSSDAARSPTLRKKPRCWSKLPLNTIIDGSPDSACTVACCGMIDQPVDATAPGSLRARQRAPGPALNGGIGRIAALAHDGAALAAAGFAAGIAVTASYPRPDR